MVTDDDLVFKALADRTRRHLLDRLFDGDGRTLTELESALEMTRFGVAKHLKVLEDAGLVIARRSGREKLHFLNAVPIRLIHDRWIDKYTEHQISALTDLKTTLERSTMATTTQTTTTVHVNRVFIKATPQAVWDAITDPEWNVRYGYHCRGEYDLRLGGAYRALASPEMQADGAPDVIIDGEVVEVDPPRRLVQTWHALFDPEIAAEPVTRLIWELDEQFGLTRLTVTHQLDGAPKTAAIVTGARTDAGGGWALTLSDLKTLLETGASLAG